MTTKVLIVNTGPRNIQIDTDAGVNEILYPNTSAWYYVWDANSIVINEIKDKNNDC